MVEMDSVSFFMQRENSSNTSLSFSVPQSFHTHLTMRHMSPQSLHQLKVSFTENRAQLGMNPLHVCHAFCQSISLSHAHFESSSSSFN